MEWKIVKYKDQSTNRADFFAMVQSGDVEGVKGMLAAKRVNFWHVDGRKNVFHVAAECENEQILKLLLDELVASTPDWARETILNMHDVSGNTPLHYAVAKRHLHHFEMLLKSGADINRRNAVGWTLLHSAIDKRDGVIVKLLLDNGASADKTNWYGRTALHLHLANYAARDISIVEMLISKSNAIDAMFNGQTALHLAVKNDDLYFVEMLLHKGASIKCRDINKNLPIHLAVSHGHTTIVEALLQRSPKGSFNTLNGDGMSPLHLAAKLRKANALYIVRLLLGHDANVNFMSGEYRTALNYATNDQIRKLIKSSGGFDINVDLFPETLIKL